MGYTVELAEANIRAVKCYYDVENVEEARKFAEKSMTSLENCHNPKHRIRLLWTLLRHTFEGDDISMCRSVLDHVKEVVGRVRNHWNKCEAWMSIDQMEVILDSLQPA